MVVKFQLILLIFSVLLCCIFVWLLLLLLHFYSPVLLTFYFNHRPLLVPTIIGFVEVLYLNVIFVCLNYRAYHTKNFSFTCRSYIRWFVYYMHRPIGFCFCFLFLKSLLSFHYFIIACFSSLSLFEWVPGYAELSRLIFSHLTTFTSYRATPHLRFCRPRPSEIGLGFAIENSA